MFLEYFSHANSENEQKRVIIDQIASLTDASAYRLLKDF
jgi:dGTP triphosphohydrolase